MIPVPTSSLAKSHRVAKKGFMICSYYPLRSTMKRDEFCTYVYFLNFTLLSRLVSLLANETLTFRARN